MRKHAPGPLRKIVGQTSLQKTLGTTDFALVRIAFYGVMQTFEATIARARMQLAGAPPEDIMVSIPMEPAMPDAVVRWDRRKPENQIHAMLAKANLIPEPREARSLDQVFEQWQLERKPRPNTIAAATGAC